MQYAYSAGVTSTRPYRQARHLRLLELLDEAGGPGALMARTGVTDTHLTACAKGRRNIGDDMAESLEAGMGKPAGWMDTAPPAQGVSHAMSLQDRKLPPPVIHWGELMAAEPLPEFETQLPDNAMAPEAPKGTRVIFVTGVQAEPGEWVLIRDRDGRYYCREFRQLRPGQWEAHARNPGFLPMDSERDGLVVVAVFDGMRGRRRPA